MTSLFFRSGSDTVEVSDLRIEDFDDSVVVYSAVTDRGRLFFEVPFGTDLAGLFRFLRVAYEEEK